MSVKRVKLRVKELTPRATVTIMVEELLAAEHTGAEYDAWLIDEGAQFGSGSWR